MGLLVNAFYNLPRRCCEPGYAGGQRDYKLIIVLRAHGQCVRYVLSRLQGHCPVRLMGGSESGLLVALKNSFEVIVHAEDDPKLFRLLQ